MGVSWFLDLLIYLKSRNFQVIVSAAAKTQLQDHERRELRQRQGQKKATGVYKLKPDYAHFMKPVEKGRRKADEYPSSDFDLDPYRKKWVASEKNCDLGNKETCRNRYMLVGRPQIGKTGVFLHLAFLLWQKVGSPPFSGPEMEKSDKIIIENCEEDEEEDEIRGSSGSSGTPGKGKEFLDPALMSEFPDFGHIRSKTLLRPNPSKRYGDPNDKNIQDWYAKGATYPPISFLKGNSLLKRRHPDQNNMPNEHERITSPAGSGDPPRRPEMKAVEVTQNRFSAKPITPKYISDSELGSKIRNSFSKHSIDHWGTLYVQKAKQAQKWIETRDTSRSPYVAHLRL